MTRKITRLPGNRPLRRTILLVCEGRDTERNYFFGLKQEPGAKHRFTITIKTAGGGSQESVVRDAIKYRNRNRENYDETWCVVDVEGSDKHISLLTAIELAKAEGIMLFLSNPSFEIWLLAHFERVARPFLDCRSVERELDRFWQQHFGRDYDKSEPRLFDLLSQFVSTAIANARWVLEQHHRAACHECNSSTEVYIPVSRFVDE